MVVVIVEGLVEVARLPGTFAFVAVKRTVVAVAIIIVIVKAALRVMVISVAVVEDVTRAVEALRIGR